MESLRKRQLREKSCEFNMFGAIIFKHYGTLFDIFKPVPNGSSRNAVKIISNVQHHVNLEGLKTEQFSTAFAWNIVINRNNKQRRNYITKSDG